jgi:hypothetical protein
VCISVLGFRFWYRRFPRPWCSLRSSFRVRNSHSLSIRGAFQVLGFSFWHRGFPLLWSSLNFSFRVRFFLQLADLPSTLFADFCCMSSVLCFAQQASLSVFSSTGFRLISVLHSHYGYSLCTVFVCNPFRPPGSVLQFFNLISKLFKIMDGF